MIKKNNNNNNDGDDDRNRRTDSDSAIYDNSSVYLAANTITSLWQEQ